MIEKKVELNKEPSGRWSLEHNGVKKETEADYPVLDFPKDSGPQLIHFTVRGPHKFSATDPIWVSDSAKPKQKEDHPQIPDWLVVNNGKSLVVLNKNSKAGTLYYNLNMESSAGSDQLDPMIKNGGGGTGIDATVQYALLAAVAGAILAIVVARFALGWRAVGR